MITLELAKSHRAAAEGRSKARNRRGVAHARLVVDGDDAERAGELLNEPAFFVVELSGAQRGDAVAAVDRHAVFLFNEGRVACLLDMAGDFLESFVPGDAFPLLGTGTAHHRVGDAVRVHGDRTVGLDDIAKAPHGRALRAQTAEVDRMIRVAFEVDQFAVARRADRAAAAGAVAADVGDFFNVLKLVRLSLTISFGACGTRSESSGAAAADCQKRALEKTSAGKFHLVLLVGRQSAKNCWGGVGVGDTAFRRRAAAVDRNFCNWTN